MEMSIRKSDFPSFFKTLKIAVMHQICNLLVQDWKSKERFGPCFEKALLNHYYLLAVGAQWYPQKQKSYFAFIIKGDGGFLVNLKHIYMRS